MQRDRRNYTFLSDDDWRRHQHDNPQELHTINKFREKELKSKLTKCTLSEECFGVDVLSPCGGKDPLRIVIIGKTGQGKSATGNNLLMRKAFQEDCTAGSITKESRAFTGNVKGRDISVMDTPGLQDTNQSNDVILREINRITKIFPTGVHAFIYVMNMANPRFTAEDRQVLDLLAKTFGGDFMSYCLIVFTHGDSLLNDMNLEQYRAKQIDYRRNTDATNTSRRRVDRMDVKDYAIFLDEILWRMVAVNNKAATEYERGFYRNVVFNIIDKMRSVNRPEVYTNEMFERAQKEKKAMEKDGLRKGWDPKVMGFVEEMINGYPEITREELQEKVRQYADQEREKEMKRREEEIERRHNERFEQMLMEQEAKHQELEEERRREHEERKQRELEMQMKLTQIEQDRENWEQQRLENERRIALERELEECRREEENARQERERKEWEKRFEEAEKRAREERERLERQAEEDRRLANERLDRQVEEMKHAHEGLLEKGLRWIVSKVGGFFGKIF